MDRAGEQLRPLTLVRYARAMSLPLDGLDTAVLVPDKAPLSELHVVEVQHEHSGEGVDEDFWSAVTVAPVHEGAWATVRTLFRRGVRPTGPARIGASTVDPDLHAAAAAAVRDLHHSQRSTSATTSTTTSTTTPGTAQAHQELEAWVQEVAELAERTADRLDDPQTWTRRAVSIEGRAYAMWTHHGTTGFAACADVGFALLSTHGPQSEAPSSLRLLTPQVVTSTWS
ncbi:hypothetical protein GCM10027586_07940 [Kineococcus gypseus]|uniref:hypothetical protein n=1 Tax=Kineococcus gypseus TaxID=1637102 RepID=UPI003D7EAD2E